MHRFSIRTLMAVILVSAVGLAALRSANDLWAGVMLLIVLAAVGMAVLGAIFVQGKERAWWTGFALFSGGYLALALVPWLSPQLGTTQVLRYAHERMNPVEVLPSDPAELAALRKQRSDLRLRLMELREISRDADPSILLTNKRLARLDGELAANNNPTPPYDQFLRVGHSLFDLLAGLLGGTVAVWFYGRRERAKAAVGEAQA